MFKKLGTILLSVSLLFGIAACSSAVETEAAELYVSVEINPSIEFIVDEDDNVISYNLLNEDAEVLCVDVDFIGMNIDDAVELFVELATEAGFIDVDSDDNEVLITVFGDEKSEIPKLIRERIRNRIMRFMAMNYINGVVLTEDFTQEDLVAQAAELGVAPGKLKLALLAQTIDEELLLEDALAMEVKDLLEIVREHHKEVISEMTDEQLALRRLRKARLINQFRIRWEQRIQNNPNLTEEQIEARIAEIRVHFMRYMIVNYVNGIILSEEFTQEDLLAQAVELDVNPDKLKLALLAQVIDPKLLLEDALEMSIRELLTIARDHYHELITETPSDE